jgi:hypothetical protein
MTKRCVVWVVWPLAAVAALTACTERPQTLGTNSKQDVNAFEGTRMPYVAAGWKQGDKTSWEQQLKTRTQMGQNDYNKVN